MSDEEVKLLNKIKTSQSNTANIEEQIKPWIGRVGEIADLDLEKYSVFSFIRAEVVKGEQTSILTTRYVLGNHTQALIECVKSGIGNEGYSGVEGEERFINRFEECTNLEDSKFVLKSIAFTGNYPIENTTENSETPLWERNKHSHPLCVIMGNEVGLKPIIVYNGTEALEGLKVRVKIGYENSGWVELNAIYDEEENRIRLAENGALKLNTRSTVYYDAKAELSWEIRHRDSEWMDLGKTEHEIFTVFGMPDVHWIEDPANKKLLYYACTQSLGESEEGSITEKIWLPYKEFRINIQLFDPEAKNDPLGYYTEYNSTISGDLLLSGKSGECGAFTSLLLETLQSVGISGLKQSYTTLWPKSEEESFFIKKWNFGECIMDNTKKYPCINIPVDVNQLRNPSILGGYRWGGKVLVLKI